MMRRFASSYLRRSALLALSCGVLFSCAPASYSFDSAARDGVYPADSGVSSPAEASYFRIRINSAPAARQGERMPFLIENPKENEENLQVQIYLKDTGETLYVSPILAPGEREAYGMVEQELSPGEYEALAVFSLLDEDGQEVGSMETAVKLTVEK